MAVPASIAFASPAQVVFDRELLAYVVGLLALVGIGIWLAVKLRSSAQSASDEGVAPLPEHSLAHYQQLLEQGHLDPQEFERIRALLRKQPPAPPTTS